jgi:Flp pilus assembly pilin Flp
MIATFLKDDGGQDVIEYALLAAFLSLVAIAGAAFLGNALQNWYTTTGSNVNSASAGS